MIITISFGMCSILLQPGPHCENVIKALYALAGPAARTRPEDLPELHPADRMEAVLAMKAKSMCVFPRWVKKRWKFGLTLLYRLQMLRGLGRGPDPNVTDCSSRKIH